MAPTLRVPYNSLSLERFLARGAGGQVFIISKRVVFKCATDFDDPGPQQVEEIEESATRIANEKATHALLMQKPHPNIVRCILCLPQGFFMERLPITLRARLDNLNEPLDPRIQARWILQLASALAWLEGLGRVHGDLRPANILLTQDDHVQLADFDASVQVGQELLAASEPFCKLNKQFQPPPAGPITEQFALASCIYTIRFGHIPLSELDAPDRVRRLINQEYPETGSDAEFGSVTRRCWEGRYESIKVLHSDIKSCCEATGACHVEQGESTHAMSDLLADCQEFIAGEAVKGD
jgi:serine/threonine protein kinase